MGSVALGDPHQRMQSDIGRARGEVRTTLWYRAPELVLGDSEWAVAIDAWSLGCLGVELVQGKPTFPATDQVDLLRRITTVFGTPRQGEASASYHAPKVCQPRPHRHGRWRRCDPNTFCWTYSLDCWISNQLLACPVRRQKHRWLHQLPPMWCGRRSLWNEGHSR